MLSRELAVVASHVPYVEKPLPPMPPEFEEAPRPRLLRTDPVRKVPELPSDWTFLNSRSAYGEALPPELARPTRISSAQRIPFSALP